MALVRYALLVGSFFLLLVAAEIFTNGIEWFGHRIGVSEGATGSVLAAFGTVLPETMIPIIAIISGGEAGAEVGVGAILGAPFMLATVAMFLVGASVLLFSSRRTNKSNVSVRLQTVQRNVGLFLVGYAIAFLAALVPNQLVAHLMGVGLFLMYLGYLYKTLTSGELIEEEGIDDLHAGIAVDKVGDSMPGMNLSEMAGDPHFLLILVQTLIAFAIFVFGANMFVEQITWVSKEVLHVPVAVVALLIAPLATELPETFNSYIWIARDKDMLAVGNITGAMAFQGTVPVTIGILFTSWNLSLNWGTSGFLNGFSVVLALVSGAYLYLRSRRSTSESLPARPFLIGGAFYLLFILVLLYYVATFNLSVTGSV
ncbi:MAG: sodium:calcium antiporter [Haloferacaceae archaeon]